MPSRLLVYLIYFKEWKVYSDSNTELIKKFSSFREILAIKLLKLN